MHCHLDCTDTDLGLISRTFSLKINKFPSFSELSQGSQCLKIGLYGQMSSHTEFQLYIMFYALDIDPTIPNIKTCTTNHKIIQP